MQQRNQGPTRGSVKDNELLFDGSCSYFERFARALGDFETFVDAQTYNPDDIIIGKKKGNGSSFFLRDP